MYTQPISPRVIEIDVVGIVDGCSISHDFSCIQLVGFGDRKSTEVIDVELTGSIIHIGLPFSSFVFSAIAMNGHTTYYSALPLDSCMA